MKNVSRNSIISICLCFCTTIALAQSSEKLRKEQERLETKIANTKTLLSKSKSSTENSLSALRLIENQISYRERLLKNYDDQIRGDELTVQRKEQQIVELNTRVDLLKDQYKELLIFAYKHRNKYSRLMFILTAKSYFEARKRNAYLRRIGELQKKQFVVIQQNKNLIAEQIDGVQKEKERKLQVVSEKKKERGAIEEDRLRKKEIYEQFKKEEEALLAQLRREEEDKRQLKSRIQAAIQKEIAEAEARRKKAEAEARANAANNTNNSSETTVVLKETKESKALSSNFASNKGKLPWPVSTGTITEHFGKNAHPTLKNVYTNNGGIDISAPKNAQVRAVFTGEITSVLNIPGAGKVVIIKHGNYRTVYSNLQDTYVTKGSKITTKKVIGSLLSKDGETVSVLHFEIHSVSGNSVTSLNPALWISH